MRVHALIGGIVGALALTGCDDTLFYGHSGGDVDATGFEGVEQIMANNCNVCHSPGGGNQGALDLETDLYGTIVNNVGYYGVTLVVPGDPEGSLFYQKTTDTQPDDNSLGGVMPIGTSGLSDTENEIIYDWIADGAPSDSGGTTGDNGTTDNGGTDTSTTDTGDTGDTGAADVATWADVEGIIVGNCVGCHSAAGSEDPKNPTYMNLTADPYDQLVGVWSAQWSDQIRVVAGVPEESLLYRKVSGDLPDDGSLGVSMPKGAEINEENAAVIYDWIKNGATQN